jgi:hypothetical protein
MVVGEYGPVELEISNVVFYVYQEVVKIETSQATPQRHVDNNKETHEDED